MKKNDNNYELIETIRQCLNIKLREGNPKDLQIISEQIQSEIKYWKKFGTNVGRGYDYRSISRKLRNKDKIDRKSRSDKHFKRDPILIKNREKIKELVFSPQFRNAHQTPYRLARLLLEHAKRNNLEFSTMSFSTLSRFLKDEIIPFNPELNKKNDNPISKMNLKILITEPESYYFGIKSKKEFAKKIEISNKNSDSENKVEKFLELIKD